MEELSEEDKQIVNRAKRIQKFLTQPLFTAEFASGFPADMCQKIKQLMILKKLLMANMMIFLNKHFIWLAL